jgi:hypothetical protein
VHRRAIDSALWDPWVIGPAEAQAQIIKDIKKWAEWVKLRGERESVAKPMRKIRRLSVTNRKCVERFAPSACVLESAGRERPR